MKQLDVRHWMVVFVSAFLQYPIIGNINPFGVAYFAAAYMWSEHRNLLPIVTFAGMAVSAAQGQLLKYFGIMLGIMIFTYILEWRKTRIGLWEMAAVLGILVVSSDLGYGFAENGVTYVNLAKYMRAGALEGLCAVGACVAFYGVMRVFLKGRETMVHTSGDNDAGFIKCRLNEMALAFRKLSKIMSEDSNDAQTVSEETVTQAFLEVTENMCTDCSRRARCWEQEYNATCRGAYELLHLCSERGYLERGQVPTDFRRRCVNIDGFLKESSCILQKIDTNIHWKFRLQENRLAFAGQIGEIADLMEGLSDEFSNQHETQEELREKLVRTLERKRLKIKKISIVNENAGRGRKRIYLMAKIRHGRMITSGVLAEYISAIAETGYMPSDASPEVVGRKYMVYEFTECPCYQLIQGSAARTSFGETISGDSSEILYLDSGQAVMMLADGMGQGQRAKGESELMLSILEQMLDTGFRRASALKLLNAFMLLNGDRHSYSSMDLTVIDLFTGMSEFVKMGASSTFIIRNKKVECVTSGSLPMGVFPEMDCEAYSRSLQDGDLIVMVSDGVVNRFEDGNPVISDYLAGIEAENPQAIAEQLIQLAIMEGTEAHNDDMTVLAAYICKKSMAVI